MYLLETVINREGTPNLYGPSLHGGILLQIRTPNKHHRGHVPCEKIKQDDSINLPDRLKLVDDIPK